MCHVTERATSVRTAGARGETISEDRCWEVEEIGKGESAAREREGSRGSYDRSREIERSDLRGGRRGTSRGASK